MWCDHTRSSDISVVLTNSHERALSSYPVSPASPTHRRQRFQYSSLMPPHLAKKNHLKVLGQTSIRAARMVPVELPGTQRVHMVTVCPSPSLGNCSLLEHRLQGLIEMFNEAVSLWVVWASLNRLDPQQLVDFGQELRHKVSPLVHEDFFRYPHAQEKKHQLLGTMLRISGTEQYCLWIMCCIITHN